MNRRLLERGPDEEGIETDFLHAQAFDSGRLERGPDEEGIETNIRSGIFAHMVLERGPDEEGIETWGTGLVPGLVGVRTRT